MLGLRLHFASLMRLAVVGLALGCMTLSGCGGGGPKLFRVSGNVTFAGQPIPFGKIYFMPDGSKENAGAAGYADIKEGKYDTSASGGQGVSGGAVIVKIDGIGGPPSNDDNNVPPPLFPPYETTADLPKSNTTKDFDVPASAKDAKPPAVVNPAPGV